MLLAAASTLAAQDPVKPLPVPPSQELPTGIRWKVALPAPPAHPPLIAAERVFVSALPGLVVAYDLKDGTALWRQTLNPEQPVAADGERLFVAGGDTVLAVNVADCSVAWRTTTGKLTAPLLAKDGWVIAASADKLFALRATDGGVIWSQESGLQRERAAISGDLLFVPLASGALRAHDLATGKMLWEKRLAGAPAEPLVVGESLYFGATDKYFYSLDARDGEEELPPIRVGAIVRSKAESDGTWVFFAGLDNLVRAIDRRGGSLRWREGVKFRPFEGPQLIGAAVAVAGAAPDVLLLSTRNGTETGRISFPESLALAPALATTGDAVIAAGISGGLTDAWTLWLATLTPSSPTPR